VTAFPGARTSRRRSQRKLKGKQEHDLGKQRRLHPEVLHGFDKKNSEAALGLLHYSSFISIFRMPAKAI
jgi:hypothetical protein